MPTRRRVDLTKSLSARRAWIEMAGLCLLFGLLQVALRKESVDRNYFADKDCDWVRVALRKESVDRNGRCHCLGLNEKWSLSARRAWIEIASEVVTEPLILLSLSARRAWIEISYGALEGASEMSLSARRAWIEIQAVTLSVV